MFIRNDGRHKVKDTRNRIVIQALRYFTQNNYEKASLNDIAGAINITKGGIYHYFTSKEELFKETVLFFLDKLGMMFINAIQPEKSLKDNIKILFKLNKMNQMINQAIGLDIFMDYTDFIYIIYTGIKKFPEIRDKINQIYSNMIKSLTKMFNKAKKRREIREDIDIEALSFELAAFSEGAMLINAAFPGQDLTRMAERCYTNFLKVVEP